METNDPIWKLMEKAPLAQPDAWFAARTLARLRRERETKRGWQLGWRWATAGFLAGMMVVLAIQTVWRNTDAERSEQLFAAFDYLANQPQSTPVEIELWPESL